MNKLFLDASAIIALNDPSDSMHIESEKIAKTLVNDNISLLRRLSELRNYEKL